MPKCNVLGRVSVRTAASCVSVPGPSLSPHTGAPKGNIRKGPQGRTPQPGRRETSLAAACSVSLGPASSAFPCPALLPWPPGHGTGFEPVLTVAALPYSCLGQCLSPPLGTGQVGAPASPSSGAGLCLFMLLRCCPSCPLQAWLSGGPFPPLPLRPLHCLSSKSLIFEASAQGSRCGCIYQVGTFFR